MTAGLEGRGKNGEKILTSEEQSAYEEASVIGRPVSGTRRIPLQARKVVSSGKDWEKRKKGSRKQHVVLLHPRQLVRKLPQGQLTLPELKPASGAGRSEALLDIAGPDFGLEECLSAGRDGRVRRLDGKREPGSLDVGRAAGA